MPEDLSNIELTDLFDMLAEQTDRYMIMLSEGGSKDEFNKCREIIIDIQTEIQERQSQQEPNSKIQDPNNKNQIPRTK